MNKVVKSILAIFAVVIGIGLVGIMLNKSSKSLELMTFPREYKEIVEAKSEEYGVPQSIIYAVIKQESGFDQNAESRVGAKGLMQIMPSTAEWINYYRGYGPKLDEIMDPQINIDYGTWLLYYLYELYGNWETCYAAYNAGYGSVSKWLKDPSYSDDGITLYSIPYEETRNYVEKIKNYRSGYIAAYDME